MALISSDEAPVVDYFIVYILSASSYVLRAFIARKKDKRTFILDICFASVFAAAGTSILFTGVVILMESLLSVVFVNCVFALISDKKIGFKIMSGLLIMAVSYFMVILHNMSVFILHTKSPLW